MLLRVSAGSPICTDPRKRCLWPQFIHELASNNIHRIALGELRLIWARILNAIFFSIRTDEDKTKISVHLVTAT